MDEVWRSCKITGKSFNSARGFLNHLRTQNLTSKEYYDKFHKNLTEGICYCGNDTTYHGFKYKNIVLMYVHVVPKNIEKEFLKDLKIRKLIGNFLKIEKNLSLLMKC